jgi:hypothetical protein
MAVSSTVISLVLLVLGTITDARKYSLSHRCVQVYLSLDQVSPMSQVYASLPSCDYPLRCRVLC